MHVKMLHFVCQKLCLFSPFHVKINVQGCEYIFRQLYNCTLCVCVTYHNQGFSLEASYRRSTAAYVVSHRRLLNLTFKRVVLVISSTETGRNNYESVLHTLIHSYYTAAYLLPMAVY